MARRRHQQGMPRVQLPSQQVTEERLLHASVGKPVIIIESTDIDPDTMDILTGKKGQEPTDG